jgi:hypothetical protein
LVAQSEPKLSAGSNGFEGDNDPSASSNEPISSPTVFNVTLCGKNQELHKEHYALLLRRGTGATVRNGVFMGFASGLDVRDSGTRASVASSIFFRNLSYNWAFPEAVQGSGRLLDKEMLDDDRGFDEARYLLAPNLRNSASDPGIGNCFDTRQPTFKPRTALTQNAAIPPDDGFFDPTARFVGAFRDRNDDWDQGRWLRWNE